MNKLKEILKNIFSNGSKTRIIVVSLVSIVMVLSLLIGSTYSIFTSSSVDENLNVYKTGVLDVTYTLSEDNITFTNKVPVAEEDVTSIKPYRITITNEGNVAYKFNVILTDTTATNKIDPQYVMTKVGKLESKALSDCTNNIIKEGVVVPANDSVIVDVRVYLSEDIQNSEIGKSFYAKLSIDGLAVYNDNDDIDNSMLIAAQMELLSSYVINKYNDGSTITTVNIGGSTDNPEVHLNATRGIMLDNNGDYRYYGADPDNYVWYNDEFWRIVSVGNVKSSATDTVGETRVKIVKADILKDDNNLSAYSYDSSASTVNSGYGVNDWSQADLMTELNSLYLNSDSGICYTGPNNASTACNFTNTGLNAEARNLTADALYYLGGSSEYEELYADDYYTFEREIRVWGSTSGQTCNDGACPRATTWTGRVGIIYPSDYAYATDLSVCTSEPYLYHDEDCYSKDWLLYTGDWQWTISPRSSVADVAFLVNSSGDVGYSGVYYADVVRPVQYLRSEVTIVEGEGTTEKPYILG